MYVEWKTTPITHINYETVKQKFKGYDKIVQKDIKKQKEYILTKYSQHIELT